MDHFGGFACTILLGSAKRGRRDAGLLGRAPGPTARGTGERAGDAQRGEVHTQPQFPLAELLCLLLSRFNQ